MKQVTGYLKRIAKMLLEPAFRRIGMKYSTYRESWKARLKLKSGSCAL